MEITEFTAAARYGFLRAPAGWYAAAHPAPTRQVAFILAGEWHRSVSDGEVRHFRPGDVLLAEDTHGKGHDTRVIGPEDGLIAIVQLPD